MALDIFWTIVLTIDSAVELSVCRGVYGCGWTVSSNIFRMMTPTFLLRYKAAI